MESVSFDRAASFYDATRGYTPGSAEAIRDGIVAHARASHSSRFLELGVGTGRIALPFITAGYDYTGVDISPEMMAKLRAKIATVQPSHTQGKEGKKFLREETSLQPSSSLLQLRYDLREADITALPFDDASFDVAVAVHVFHLVGDRRTAMAEARRVLKPSAPLFHGHDTSDDDATFEGVPSPMRVRRIWVEIVRELSGAAAEQQVTRWVTTEQLAQELQQTGATTEIVKLARYSRPPLSARQMADLIQQRIYSSDWRTSDDIHAEATRRIEAWLATQPNIDTPVSVAGDFVTVVARWAV